VNAKGHAQIADFGLAVAGDNTGGRPTDIDPHAGTMRFQAPEQLKGSSPGRRSPVDVYAFACLCYEVSTIVIEHAVCLYVRWHQLYTGNAPFHHLKTETMILAVINGDRPRQPLATECRIPLSNETWEIMTKCWKDDAMSRPSMFAAAQHFNPDIQALPPIEVFEVGGVLYRYESWLSKTDIQQNEPAESLSEPPSKTTSPRDRGWLARYRSQLLEDGLQRINASNELVKNLQKEAMDEMASDGIAQRSAQSVLFLPHTL
jgi:serine/threonine protein kinase